MLLLRISRNEIIADFRANDPLAWGFFMGLAFIFTSLSLAVENPKIKKIKITAMVCGCLCLLGLLGPILDITSIWFIAVAGYGIGTPVICVLLLEFIKNQD
jgi:cyanate permease